MRPIANLSSHTTLRFGGPRTPALLPRKRGRRAPVQLCFKPVNHLLQDLHQVTGTATVSCGWPVQLCFKAVNRLLQDLHLVCAGAGVLPAPLGT